MTTGEDADEEPDPSWKANDPFAGKQLRIGPRTEEALPTCPTCHNEGLRRVPGAQQPFVLFENEPAPEPSVPLGWTPCPDCPRGKQFQELMEAERERLAKRLETYAAHEKKLGLHFVDFETRHVTGHFQSSPTEARECAIWMERVSEALREHCGGSAYLAAKPETQQLVLCENEAAYTTYLENFAQQAGHNEEDWIKLARKTASYGSRGLTVIRRDLVLPPRGSGLGNMVVFAYAHMLIREATGNKAPPWFEEGFSSLCESLVFPTPVCYSIRYEENKLNFGVSWSQAVAEGLKKGQTRSWETVFTLDLIGLSVLDYQQCWSMARFLYSTNGPAFEKLPGLYQKGLQSRQAIEEAYGQPLSKLEAAWQTWAKQ